MTTEEAGLWEEEKGALVAGSCQLGLAASWTSSLGWCVCWPELPPGLLLRTALSPAEGTGCCEGDVSDGDVSWCQGTVAALGALLPSLLSIPAEETGFALRISGCCSLEDPVQPLR